MNGENFLIEYNGEIAKHGFFQTFYLEAESSQQAEDLAVKKILENDELIEMTKNSKNDSPLIFCEEIKEITSFDGIESMETGKIWFPDNKKTEEIPTSK